MRPIGHWSLCPKPAGTLTAGMPQTLAIPLRYTARDLAGIVLPRITVVSASQASTYPLPVDKRCGPGATVAITSDGQSSCLDFDDASQASDGQDMVSPEAPPGFEPAQ